LSLDILALALMCCLLAAVVGVLVLGGEQQGQAGEGPAPVASRWPELRRQSSQLVVQVSELERSSDLLVAKLNRSGLERENHSLQTRVSLLERNVQLIQRLAALEAETKNLEREQAQRREKEAATASEKRRLLGEYRGPYVLLECIEDGALVYPDGGRLPSAPSAEELNRVLQMIRKAGYVAFVARPSGWFNSSYDKLRALVYKELDSAAGLGGSPVGRSCIPLDSSEPITNYLPSEGGP
jgi:hypothetical protein